MSAANLHFACTLCARCCRGHRLPLTVDEAIAWLSDDHPVELLIDAAPWTREPTDDDLPAQHRRRRSFAARSGTVPVRVTVILTADLGSACPYLAPDGRCSNHTARPLVCRVYPAEINPFVAIDPAQKLCPDEAWAPSHPLLVRNGAVADATTAADIVRSRDTDAADTGAKARACAALGISVMALGNEGFTVHAPDLGALRGALEAARAAPEELPDTDWRFATNQRRTLDALREIGASAVDATEVAAAGGQYLAFRAPQD